MATKNKLALIANSMQDSVARTGRHAYRRLPAGLELVVQRMEGGRWRLAMAREAPSSPSEMEIEIVCQAFSVPSEARLSRVSKWFRHPKTQREIRYEVAELTWIELGRA